MYVLRNRNELFPKIKTICKNSIEMQFPFYLIRTFNNYLFRTLFLLSKDSVWILQNLINVATNNNE